MKVDPRWAISSRGEYYVVNSETSRERLKCFVKPEANQFLFTEPYITLPKTISLRKIKFIGFVKTMEVAICLNITSTTK
jgi:hypothetical protein